MQRRTWAETRKRLIEWGTYLIIFLLPLQTRWIIDPAAEIEYWRYSVYGVDVLILLLALFVFISSFPPRMQLRGKLRRESRNKKNLLICSVILWSVLATLWSTDPGIALYQVAELIIAGLLIWLIVVSAVPFKNMIVTFVGSAVVQAVFGIGQFFMQTVWSTKWLGMAVQNATTLGASVIEAGGERWLRAYGILPHPNMLGGWLAVGLVLSAGLFVKNERKSVAHRIFLISAIIILASGLFFTFSRSAWLAFGIGVIVLVGATLVVARKRAGVNPASTKELCKIFFAILLTCGILSVMYWPLVQIRFTGESRLEQISINERTETFNEWGKMIKDHWFLGVGASNYISELARRFPDRPPYSYQPVHNVWLLLWAEFGIVGMIIFIFLFIYFFNYLKHKKTTVNPLQMGVLGACAGLLVISLFDHYLWSLHSGLLMTAFVVGIALSAFKESKTNTDS